MVKTSSSDFTSPRRLQSPAKNPLAKLANNLSVYDLTDLLTALAALQLMPENADRTFRFEVLTHVVASISNKGFGSKRKINLKQLEKICRCDSLGLESLVRGEDPFDNPFTEAFYFYGGSYIVFPGIAEEPTFILHHLAKAIFLNSEPFQNQRFTLAARSLLLGVLAISSEIAQRAGLSRGLEPVSAPGRDPIIPASQRLEELKQAVSFSQSQLSKLLAKHNVSLFDIEKLIVNLGDISIADYQIDNGDLLISPIVRTNGRFIVAIPGILLSATRNEIIRLADECGVVDELAKRYQAAVWSTVVDSLGYINNHYVRVHPTGSPDISYFQEAFFSFDSDKLTYVALVTDPLNDYDPHDPFGRWNLDDIGRKLEVRLQEIYKFAFTQLPGINEIFFLLICQGFGRLQVLGFNKLPGLEPLLLLGLTAADLETITLLEGGNPLVLWKYAWASWRLENQAEVISLGELNRFYFYRKNGHTFYQYDEGRPNFILLGMGGAGDLRREVLHQRDWHAVPSFNSGYVTEVTSLFGTRDIPIYFPRAILSKIHQPTALLVEVSSLFIWIVGYDHEAEDQEIRSLYRQFAETIGYWLWQFDSPLAPILELFVLNQPVLKIRLNISSDPAWSQIQESKKTLEETLVYVEVDTTSEVVDVTILPDISLLLQQANNEGERYLMRSILEGFRLFLPNSQSDRLSEDVIISILNQHAPLGIKKKLFFLNTSINPELEPDGLPNYRKVQEADEDELFDELGSHLSSAIGLGTGEIPDQQRTAVLNKAVGFFYLEFVKLVASLNPEGLLEDLVAHHEAIVRETAFYRLTIPTRLACFSSESEMTEKLREELPERQKAARTSRFVIEYVVAQPPAGIRPLSLSVYDYLQALASQITNFGFESDLIKWKLADIKRRMLPSGRLGANRDEFEKARDAHLLIFAGGEIVRATKGFKRHWTESESLETKSELVVQMDAAATVEFGYSITELQELFGEAISIGRSIHPTVATLPLKELISYLSARLGWSQERVSQAVELLSLKARSDFLEPESPYQPADVYPWRYNRSLSYLRRPFLCRKQGGVTEVVWGIRHLYAASQYLLYLCVGGRLKVQSSEMKKVTGNLRNKQGEEFNDEVADFLEQNLKLVVRRRVRKIGKVKIQGKSGDLGDIDVLVADPKNFCIKVIECKNFNFARAPHEMKNELEELFMGRLKGNGKWEKSAVEHHQERVDWVHSHLHEVLTWLHLDPSAHWKVEPLVVTDYELVTPYLWTSSISVISLLELARALDIAQ